MAKWEMVSRPKDQGGLGIINTRLMNDCLLVKWIWKILLEPDELWFKLLKAKYMSNTNFFSSKSKGGSQFFFTKLNIYSNGELLLQLAMGITVFFGMIVGCIVFL
jgi:hypothetical protein